MIKHSIIKYDEQKLNKMAIAQEKKQKIVLCISGMAGSGKSTVAKRIAKKCSLNYLSGGDVLKALASDVGFNPESRGWWESPEGFLFLKKRSEDFSFDRKVDEKLQERARQGDVVLDSWAQAWLIDEGFKIWLDASTEERAKRIAKRDKLSYEEALKALKKKEKLTKMIYKKMYGFDLGEDFSPFDVILDVTHLSEVEVFQVISLIVHQLLNCKK
jgi:cytidylate kinase